VSDFALGASVTVRITGVGVPLATAVAVAGAAVSELIVN